MEDEIWKPAVGYPELAHVEVSNWGRVRTLDRAAPSAREFQPVQVRKGRVLSPWRAQNGYLYVAIKIAPKRFKYTVHRLVGRAFVPGYFEGASIDHINGDKLNNRPANLQWVTLAKNTALQWETGLVDLRGENHPSAKLSDAETGAIAILLRDGFTQVQLAEMFGVSTALISKIRRGKKPVKFARNLP